MAMTKEIYRYQTQVSVEEFKSSNTIPFSDENGRPTILIRNSGTKTVVVKGHTDDLEYHLNSVITKDGEKFFFHVIRCIKDDAASREQFDIAYKYLFKKISHPLKDIEMQRLISSLQSLFKVSKEKDLSNLRTGVYGELLFLFYVHQNGYPKILEKYHSDFFSKHDIEIDDKRRIEIKTSASPVRIHRFKHDQICRTDVSVFVASLVLEKSEEGVTLYELFEKMESLAESADELLTFGQLKSFCKISEEDQGPSFAFERAISLIRLLKANDLPHLNVLDCPGVTSIAYDVDCALAKITDVKEFIKLIS